MSESSMAYYNQNLKYGTFPRPDDFASEMTERKARIATQPCWVWRLVDKDGNKLPYRLLWGKYGPCWQHEVKRNLFMSAHDGKIIDKETGQEVFEKEFEEPCEATIGLNSKGEKFVQIKRKELGR